MQVELARYWALILIPVFFGIVIAVSILDRKISGKSYGRSKSRRVGEIVLRCIVLLLAIMALAGVTIKKSSDVTTTVFLMDMSDSTKANWENEVSFVHDSISKMPEKNQAGIIVFGADAQIEQFVSDKKVFTDVQSKVLGTSTNLEQAVNSAMALFPDSSAKRIVLLTDGLENEGNLGDIAVTVAGSEVEFKTVEYNTGIENEVYVSNVDMPESISEGDKFEVTVDIYSTQVTNARVSLYSGRTLKGQKDVALQKGENHLVFADQGVENGLKSYRVTVEADSDTVTVNNAYSAFTTVKAPSKVLLVEGNKNEAREFKKVLKACNIDYDMVSPSGVPNSISDMLIYQSIILLDVYADDLREGFMDTADTYVKDYAGGFVAIGGPNSYALGNYKDTPLEKILPVKMDLEGEKEIPKIAMVMVIDHSGSMGSASNGNYGATCLDLAKQAAVNSLDALRDIDEVGVVAFDDTYDWAVELQPATDHAAISEKIEGIPYGGGTSIYPALDVAIEEIEKSDAAIKHVVLLTDGQDGYRQYSPILEELSENQITLSTVAIGSEADTGMLKWLSEEGNGRYYYSDASNSLPRIFAQEVYLSSKSYLINEEFTPVIVNSNEIIQDVFKEGSPSLLGYVATTPKEMSTVLLESHREDPVLAVWQYGLGKSVAWTSDGSNEWTGNFAGWDNYATLWRNILDWTISESELGDDTLTVSQKASSAVISYQTSDYSSDTKVSAMITDEEGAQKEIQLKPSTPGSFQAEIPLDEVGVYTINLRNQKGEEVVKNINTATAMQYSQEYRFAEVSSNLGAFVEQVLGKQITEPKEVFDTHLKGASARTDITRWLLIAAVFLFVLDIIFRRMHIDWLAAVSEKCKDTIKNRNVAAKRQTGLHGDRATDMTTQNDKLNLEKGVSEDIPQGKIGAGKGDKKFDNDSVSKDKKVVDENAGKDKKSDSENAGKDKKMDSENVGKNKNVGKKSMKKKSEKKKEQKTVSTIDTAALLKKKQDRELK